MDPKQQQASRLASEALNDALDARYHDAEPKIRAAVELAIATRHHSLPIFRGQLGAVLAELGRPEEALMAYVRSVEDALSAYPEASAVVSVCRYFLAEQLLRMHEPERALMAVTPALTSTNHHGPLKLIEAIARWELGDLDAARAAAQLAIQYAASEAQAEGFRSRLHGVLE